MGVVKELRGQHPYDVPIEMGLRAADEIERLRAALMPFAAAAAMYAPYAAEMGTKEVTAVFTLGQLRAAAAVFAFEQSHDKSEG